MIATTVNPLDLRVGQRIHFEPTPASKGSVFLDLDEGRIAAKTLQGVLVEAGETLAGTKVLLRVPHERITGVWLGPPVHPEPTLVPVRELQHASPHRLLSRIFRDTSAALAPASGAHSLDDDRTPWAS